MSRRTPQRAAGLMVSIVVLAALTAGCTAPTFPDATAVWEERNRRGTFEGDHRFDVANGTGVLRIAVAYELPRGTTFAATVHAPNGAEVHGLRNLGPVTEEDPRWLVLRAPAEGAWEVRARLDGPGRFAFGAYLET